MSQTSGLTVRQHEREGIEVPVEFLVCDEHGGQVHFSPASSASGQHAVRGKAVDISAGGMGLECRQFMPRMCEGIIRVFGPDPIGTAADGSPILETAFEHRVKVRRVYLIGRDPLYALGVAFVDPQPEIDQRIAELLSRLQGTCSLPMGGPGKGGPNA